jgi:hypothetical protein
MRGSKLDSTHYTLQQIVAEGFPFKGKLAYVVYEEDLESKGKARVLAMFLDKEDALDWIAWQKLCHQDDLGDSLDCTGDGH